MPPKEKVKSNKTQNGNAPSAHDVIIIGAGAAGLAAAAALSPHGLKILVLEARDRIGGRILTERSPRFSSPIELGAEFIHGTPVETFSLITDAGLSAYDVLDKHDRFGPNGVSEIDFFESVQKLMERLNPHPAKDRSFEEFLEEHGKDFEPETRNLAKAYVQGFQAAAIDEISEQSLAETDEDSHECEGAQEHANYRLFDGYDKLVSCLQSKIANANQVFHLSSCAHRLEWSKENGVKVFVRSLLNGQDSVFEAKRAIVTLPAGVLRSSPCDLGHIEFLPKPPELTAAIEGMRMGSAIRVILEFKSRFWERLFAEPAGYLHGSQELAFPTWWTSMPVRSPVLTAWAGGPKADKLYGKTKSELTELAVQSLCELLKPLEIEESEVRKEVLASHHYDWLGDPFSRGSYSFAGVGGVAPIRRLKKSFDDVLFFAGEATEAGDARGTVHGAIASGERSARLILKLREL